MPISGGEDRQASAHEFGHAGIQARKNSLAARDGHGTSGQEITLHIHDQ
jgi:hypothetical protein